MRKLGLVQPVCGQSRALPKGSALFSFWERCVPPLPEGALLFVIAELQIKPGCVASKTRRQKVSEHGLRSMPRFLRKAIIFAFGGTVRTRSSAVIWALNWE